MYAYVPTCIRVYAVYAVILFLLLARDVKNICVLYKRRLGLRGRVGSRLRNDFLTQQPEPKSNLLPHDFNNSFIPCIV